ncbi:Salicylic acid-binding protein 2, partial [Mucuna pruriens]
MSQGGSREDSVLGRLSPGQFWGTTIEFHLPVTRRLGSTLEQQYFILDNNAPILSSLGVQFLASRMYQLSPSEDLTLAFSLVRALPPFLSNVKLLTKQTAVTKNKNGRVPKVFIITEKDNLITEDFQRWIIENTAPYAEVKVIKDSDHMPIKSHQQRKEKDKAKSLKMFKQESYILVILVLFFHTFCVNGKHFVLVHGGLHGAWCWYKVANQLKSFGHNVTTLDMAASGINPKQMQEVLSVSEYHEPLMTFMASLPSKEKVILVGHSLGGLSVSIAMEKYPKQISVAVFITATVVSQNLTYLAFLQERGRRTEPIDLDKFFILDGHNKAPTLTSLGVKLLASRFYQLSSPEDLTLAFSLVRPLPLFRSDVKLLTKETAVTKYKNGRVPKIFIITEKDNLQKEDFQWWIIESTGPYVEVKVIKDSDHMVANQLKLFGHNVTILDMAASGINPKQMQEVLSVSEYHEPLITFMASLPPKEKVILVGHSLGGLSVSIAMEKYPKKISVAVFLTATVVSQNLTYSAYLQEVRRRLGSLLEKQYFILNGPNKPPILSSPGVQLLASRLYQLSPAQDLTLALSLVRPLPPFMSDVKLLRKQTAVTKNKNGRVSKVFIISERDNLQTEDFQRWIIENTGPYAEVKVIKDSDHM